MIPTSYMHTECSLPNMLLSNKNVSQTLILFSSDVYLLSAFATKSTLYTLGYCKLNEASFIYLLSPF